MSLPEFEAVLKEVVTAKRLSASKMTNLTDLTMKNMEHDTQLVSILYRTHKSLPTATAKISSLYVFDALARAAKSHATKHGLTGDAFTHPGNSASFLFKVGGVVEGLFQDMVTHGSTETKEKTKKILDIWVKGSTFPPELLSQLAKILKGVQQESVDKSTPPAVTPQAQPLHIAQPAPAPVQSIPLDPRTSAPAGYLQFQTPPAATPPAPMADPQAALLALLAKAAANNPSLSIPSLQPNATPPAAVPQMAVLQQLANTAVSVPPVPQFLPPTDRVNIQNIPSSSGVNGSAHSPPSYRNEPRVMVKSEQRYSGYRSPENEPRTDSRFDERDNMRGRLNGGFRGRGRGDTRGLGRNWDQRDRDYYRNSERDQSPPRGGGRRGRSRSRSPPSRYRDSKVSRFSSPPRRSMADSPPAWRPPIPARGPQPPESGKDEFGRDVRPESPKSPVTSQPLPPVQQQLERPKSPVPTSQTPTDPRQPLAATTTTNHVPNPSVTSSVQPNIPPAKPVAPVSNGVDKQNGMDSFNLATFDLTSPASWEALGKMWHVTHGYLPSTEELMAFVIAQSQGGGNAHAAAGPGMNNHHQAPKPAVPTGPSRGFGRGRGTFGRGRGGSVHGQNGYGRQNEGGWGYNDYNQTDAIVLGGGGGGGGNAGSNDTAQQYEQQQQFTNHNQGLPATAGSGDDQGSAQGGGRMQRIGDKWVFVRGTNVEAA